MVTLHNITKKHLLTAATFVSAATVKGGLKGTNAVELVVQHKRYSPEKMIKQLVLRTSDLETYAAIGILLDTREDSSLITEYNEATCTMEMQALLQMLAAAPDNQPLTLECPSKSTDKSIKLTWNTGKVVKQVVEDEVLRVQKAYQETIDIQLDAFLEAYKTIARSVGKDETRPHICGVSMIRDDRRKDPYLRMQATDGHRASVVCTEIPVQDTFGVTVPVKLFQLLQRAKPLIAAAQKTQLYTAKRFLGINIDRQADTDLYEIDVTTRLLDVDYPNISAIFPSASNWKVMLLRADVLDITKRLSTAKEVTCVLESIGDMLQISAGVTDCYDSLAISWIQQDSIKIGLNFQYLLDALETLSGESVFMQSMDSLSPVLVESNKKTEDIEPVSYEQHVIMPMRT